MEETIVRWVLSRETEYLQKLLSQKLAKLLGSELTTSFGRIDLAYRTDDGDIMLIELETAIDSEAKLRHAVEQVRHYSKFASSSTPSKVFVVLLYAEEGTPKKYHRIINGIASDSGVLVYRYSILMIKRFYDRHIARITLNSGAPLSRAVALGVSSLSWLTKIIAPFAVDQTNMISWAELQNRYNSKTNFYVLKRLAEDFELITKYRRNRTNYLKLTTYGERYADMIPEDMLPEYLTDTTPSHDNTHLLTPLEIRRLLIEILLNNNFTKTKVNIFQFLRYINITAGELLPKRSTVITPDELNYLNNFFGSSYNEKTLLSHFQQLYKYCNELGLMERIVCRESNYDKAMLTSLGSRILTCFELNLHLSRERHQIPLQVVE